MSFEGGNYIEIINTENPSRIINNELKEILPELIKLQEKTYKEDRLNDLNISFLTTENHVYVHVSKLDCEKYLPYYFFDEKMDSNFVRLYIFSDSFQPERYFDLTNLTKQTEQFQFTICDDFYFLSARLLVVGENLRFEEINTMYDNQEKYYADEDYSFLKKINYLVEVEEIKVNTNLENE